MLFHSLGGKVDEIITIFLPTWEVTDGKNFIVEVTVYLCKLYVSNIQGVS